MELQFNLIDLLRKQQEFSQQVYGPHPTRNVMVCIKMELQRVIDNPDDVLQWADVLLMVFDGAMHRGFTPEEIAAAMEKSLNSQLHRPVPARREPPTFQFFEFE